MKKVLSIALALIMVLSTMIMLVPTASAAETTDVAATGVGGKVYYEQDFDDLDPTLVGKDLAAAIGWTAPDKYTALMLEDGRIRIVKQYTKLGDYPVPAEGWGETNSWSGTYRTHIAQDLNMTNNSTVVEYTMKINRRPAGSEDVIVTTKDGTTTTIKADGQGTYQGFGFEYKYDQINEWNWLFRHNTATYHSGSNGFSPWNVSFKAWDSAAVDAPAYNKRTSLDKVSDFPDMGEQYVLEYSDNPTTAASEEHRAGAYFNTDYNVKIIVEPHFNRTLVFVNDVLVAAHAATNAAQYTDNDWNRSLTDTLDLLVKPGMDVEMDNIKVYDYVPGLQISEIMTNGQFRVNGTTLQSPATAKGKYQWIEITNPSAVPVNVYDYGVHIFNMPTYTSTIGSEDLGANSAAETGYYAGGAPTMGYFTPGAKTLGAEVFNSPAYEDGVLQPGESAIVLLPYTAMDGGTSVTDEAFKNYLVGLGMPADTMLLVADNESDYPFALSHHSGEGASVSIMKVTNTAKDGSYAPKADAFGQSTAYINAYAECTVIITSKIGGGTNYYSMKVVDAVASNNGFNGNFPASALDGATAWTKNTDASFEISYTGWDAEHNNLKWGFAKYAPTEARKGIAGTDVAATPGFVPVDCRRSVGISAYGTNGKAFALDTAKVLTDSTVTFTAPAAKAGFAIDAYLDGELYAEDVTAETAMNFAIAASDLTADADIKVEFKYRALGANIIGIQQADDNTIRILAGVSNLDLENDTLGFTFMMNYWGADSDVIEYECAYVYTAVTENGAVKTAASYGYDYLFALHINNAPLDALESDLIITAEAMLNGEPSPIGAVEFTFSPAAAE